MGPLRRLGLLLRRSWRQTVRDGWINGIRLGVSTGLAFVFGEIFGRLGLPTALSVAERVALLSYAAITMSMMALMKTLDVLGRERLVVARESARGLYGAFEYVVAKLVTELPLDAAYAAGFGALLHWRVGLRLPSPTLVGMLALTAACCAGLGLAVGAVAPTADTALALGIPIMLVYMMVGVLNPAGSSPKPPSAGVRQVQRASPIRWSIRGLCCAELRGMTLDPGSLQDAPRMGGLALVRSGDAALARLGLEDETAERCATRLAQTLGIELCVAVFGLWLTRPRFQDVRETGTAV